MSVEPSEAMSEVWTRWQGQIIDGVFPLGRLLGCSDHSAVFVTKFAERGPSEVAIKLVPIHGALAEPQLFRWQIAGSLAHPHLLRLLEWGSCRLEGLPYLYVVMEYADQTLAQVLTHRALTDPEAREMLLPILDALTFLHGQDLVQGQLKPANILVVGDQLKLASDTIGRVNEIALISKPTPYNPPEMSDGSSVVAGDIWGLGVTLFETLTRRAASRLGHPNRAITLPGDFPPAFRNVVTRCLSPKPQDRPSVRDLAVWARDGSAEFTAEPSSVDSAAPERAEPTARKVPPIEVAPEAVSRAPSRKPSKRRTTLLVTLGALLVLAIVSIFLFLDRKPPAAPTQTEAPTGPPPQTAPVSSVGEAQALASTASAEAFPIDGVSASPLHQVLPDVAESARRTIRGHIKVSVRVTVDRDGSVSAAVAERGMSSAYFRRAAIEAAEKWTFPPANTPSSRLMRIRFEFGRDQTTARAVTLR